jgi:hypothetical protein
MSETKNKKTAVGEAESSQVATVAGSATESETATVITTAETETFVYIGPSIPKSVLKNGAMLIGTREEVLKYLADNKVCYEEVQQLIVPIQKLAGATVRLQSGGNLLAANYETLRERIETQGGND